MCFEKMSGLKINYHKSEVIVMGWPPEIMQRVADMLNCNLGDFSFIYLGLPISYRKITMDQWMFLVHKTGSQNWNLTGKVPFLGRKAHPFQFLPCQSPNVCNGFVSTARRSPCEIWFSLCPVLFGRSRVIRPKHIYFLEHFCCCLPSILCVLNATNTD
jgi:hypothetical protein